MSDLLGHVGAWAPKAEQIATARRALGAALDDDAVQAEDLFGARNVTVLEADTNGDRNADFAIELTGNKTLTDNDLRAVVILRCQNQPPTVTVTPSQAVNGAG